MRIFLAGATGVIGIRLVPLLAAEGYEVAGMTRHPENIPMLHELGALPVVCDVFDAEGLRDAVTSFGPEIVMHQLTDLPDDVARIGKASANARMRREGTRNLLAAASACEADRFLAQSVAWQLSGDAGEAVSEHERAVLDAGGVVLRYGQFYGPRTYHEGELPSQPRIQIDAAAWRTVELLDAPSGVVEITEA